MDEKEIGQSAPPTSLDERRQYLVPGYYTLPFRPMSQRLLAGQQGRGLIKASEERSARVRFEIWTLNYK